MQISQKIICSLFVLFLIFPLGNALGGQEEQLYHQLLDVKEKKIQLLEKKLAKAQKQIEMLETQAYGKPQSKNESDFSDSIEVGDLYPEQEQMIDIEDLAERQDDLAYEEAVREHHAQQAYFQSPQSRLRRQTSSLPERGAYMPTAAPAAFIHQEAPDWQWRGAVEALYLKPRLNDLIYAQQNDNNGAAGSTYKQDFDNEPGVRVSLERRVQNQWILGGFMQYFAADAKSHTSGSNLVAAPGFGMANSSLFTSASAKTELDLWHSGLYGKKVISLSPFALTVTPGIDFAYFTLDQDYQYQNASNVLTQSQKQSFKGAGPSIALEGKYSFNPYFSADLNFGIAGLFGEHQTKFSGAQVGAVPATTTPVHFKDYAFIPHLTGGVGVAFENKSPGDRGYGIRVGYGFENWIGIDRPVSPGVNSMTHNTGVSGRKDRNMTLDGVRLEVSTSW